MTRRRSRSSDELRLRELGRALDESHVRLLRLLSYGMTVRHAAQLLDVSTDTVKARCRMIYARLGAVNAANAVRLGFEGGYLGDDVPDALPDVVVDESDLEDEVDP